MIPSYLSAARNTKVPVTAENWDNFSEYCRGAHYLPAAAGSYWGVVAGAEEQGDRVPREQARHAPPLSLRLPRRWLSQEKRFCKVGTVLNIWILIGTVDTFTDLVALWVPFAQFAHVKKLFSSIKKLKKFSIFYLFRYLPVVNLWSFLCKLIEKSNSHSDSFRTYLFWLCC